MAVKIVIVVTVRRQVVEHDPFACGVAGRGRLLLEFGQGLPGGGVGEDVDVAALGCEFLGRLGRRRGHGLLVVVAGFGLDARALGHPPVVSRYFSGWSEATTE